MLTGNVPFDAEQAVTIAIKHVSEPPTAVTQANRQLVKKLAWQRRNHDPQLQRWLSRIRIPTHIVWGADDRLFPPIYGETWAKAIAGAQLTVIPRCGHLPIQEQPDIFAASVAEFCARA